MTVKIKGTFRKDAAEYNGLDDGGPIYKALQTDPLRRVPVVGFIEVARNGKNYEKGGVEETTIRFVSIEAVVGDDAVVVKEIHDKRFRERTGRSDVQASLFDQVDPAANADADRLADVVKGQAALPAASDAEPPPDDDDDTGDGKARRRPRGSR